MIRKRDLACYNLSCLGNTANLCISVEIKGRMTVMEKMKNPRVMKITLTDTEWKPFSREILKELEVKVEVMMRGKFRGCAGRQM